MRYRAEERWQAVRRDGDRPARLRLERDWQVTASIDEQAVGVAVRQMGWRVYATKRVFNRVRAELEARAMAGAGGEHQRDGTD